MKIEMDDVIAVLSQELGVDSEGIKPQTKLADVPEWNSLGMVRFLLACDEQFGQSLAAAAAASAETVAELQEKMADNSVAAR